MKHSYQLKEIVMYYSIIDLGDAKQQTRDGMLVPIVLDNVLHKLAERP